MTYMTCTIHSSLEIGIENYEGVFNWEKLASIVAIAPSRLILTECMISSSEFDRWIGPRLGRSLLALV